MSVRFHHLRGEKVWLRCDHLGTRLHRPSMSIRLAHAETVDRAVDDGDRLLDPDSPPYVTWQPLRTGAVRVEPDPARCSPESLGGDCVLAASDGRLLFTAPPGDARHRSRWYEVASGLAGIRDMCRDRCGRLFLLEPGDRITVLSARTLDRLRTFDAPAGTRAIAATDAGLFAIDGVHVHFTFDGSVWSTLLGGEQTPTGYRVRLVAVAAFGGRAVVLARSLRRAWLGELTPAARGPLHGIELDDPLPLIVLPDDSVLVGELEPEREPGGLMRFTRYRWSDSGPSAEEDREVVRFDGRGLVALDDLTVLASTRDGWTPLYRVRETFVPEGQVETFALDSGRFGCVWHRVFLDVCAPPGTSFAVEARTSDAAYDASLARRPRAPEGVDAAQMLFGDPYLGSRTVEDREGWIPVGVLDTQPLLIDHPWPGRDASAPADVADTTLEGLIKNPGGRYLWLRIRMYGKRHRSPVLTAVRVHFPRPSMLAFLPAYWRADPELAARMDELLALFEAPLSRIEGRLDALHRVFDPRTTPPEALTWLASFVALRLDDRLPERVRRRLLDEMTGLYRQRGTVIGIERLCSILAEARVRVIEAWRLRRRRGSMLGLAPAEPAALPGAVLGAGMQLGGVDEFAVESDDGARVRGFFGKHAHRFSVIVFRACEPTLQSVLNDAVELAKPAHTVHELCWAGAGMRLGFNSYVGVGTVPSTPPALEPVRVGDSGVVLGAGLLGRADPASLPAAPSHCSPEGGRIHP